MQTIVRQAHHDTSVGNIHEQLQAAYGGKLPFLPSFSVPTHSVVGNAQLSLSKAQLYGKVAAEASTAGDSDPRLTEFLAASDAYASSHERKSGAEPSQEYVTPPSSPPPTRWPEGRARRGSTGSETGLTSDPHLDAVIESLTSEFDALNSQYSDLLTSASSLRPEDNDRVQGSLKELADLMLRKVRGFLCHCAWFRPHVPLPPPFSQKQQLSLLIRAQRSVIRKSRSPLRSPASAAVRSDALRTLAHLKDLAAAGTTTA